MYTHRTLRKIGVSDGSTLLHSCCCCCCHGAVCQRRKEPRTNSHGCPPCVHPHLLCSSQHMDLKYHETAPETALRRLHRFSWIRLTFYCFNTLVVTQYNFSTYYICASASHQHEQTTWREVRSRNRCIAEGAWSTSRPQNQSVTLQVNVKNHRRNIC